MAVADSPQSPAQLSTWSYGQPGGVIVAPQCPYVPSGGARHRLGPHGIDLVDVWGASLSPMCPPEPRPPGAL